MNKIVLPSKKPRNPVLAAVAELPKKAGKHKDGNVRQQQKVELQKVIKELK